MTCFLCCRCLATGDSFKTIAYSFHVGASTVSKIVPDVVTTIWDCLMGEFMDVPSTVEVSWGEVWGAVEFSSLLWSTEWQVCHSQSSYQLRIPVLQIQGNTLFSSPGNCRWPILLQGVMEDQVMLGFWPSQLLGKCFDLALLNCMLTHQYQELTTKEPSHIYLLLIRLFLSRKPSWGHSLGTSFQESGWKFNYCLSYLILSLVMEDTFIILSFQWRMYRHAIEVHPEDAGTCVKATCVLHILPCQITAVSRSILVEVRWSHCQVWEDLLRTTLQERPSGLGQP